MKPPQFSPSITLCIGACTVCCVKQTPPLHEIKEDVSPPRRKSLSISFALIVLFILPALSGPAMAQGQIVFNEHILSSSFNGARSVYIADIDNDGDKDIAGTADVADAIHWWEQAEDGIWIEHKVDTLFDGANVVLVQDLDADGDPDLLGVADTADEIAWWEQVVSDTGLVWIKHVIDDEVQGAYAADLDDLDQDGDPDVLIAAIGASDIVWCESATVADTLVWAEQAIDEDMQQATTIRTADLDNDGDLDVVAGNLGGTIIWWENDGFNELTWTRHPIDIGFTGAHDLEIGDIDGDDDPDIIGAALTDGEVIWWENVNNADSWVSHPVDLDAAGARAVALADLDADGDMDVVGTVAGLDKVIWWENLTGTGQEWGSNPIDEDFDFGIDVQIDDVDGDGDLDIVGAALKGDMISWWEQDFVLPVSLTAFEGIGNGNEADLFWETATELNNSGFHIQLKTGSTYQNLAFVTGVGTTNEPQYYRYRAENLNPGVHVFRLKQVDFDGTFSYSPEISVAIAPQNGRATSSIYPNPFNPDAQFSLVLTRSQQVKITVFNTLGQEVARLFEGSLSSDTEHRFSFTADDLPGGLYIFRTEGERFAMEDKALLIK